MVLEITVLFAQLFDVLSLFLPEQFQLRLQVLLTIVGHVKRSGDGLLKKCFPIQSIDARAKEILSVRGNKNITYIVDNLHYRILTYSKYVQMTWHLFFIIDSFIRSSSSSSSSSFFFSSSQLIIKKI